MRRWRPAVAVGVLSLVCACTAADPVPVAVDAPAPRTPESAAAPRTEPAAAPDLAGAVTRAVADTGAVDLGLAVLDLATGVQTGSRADVPFPTASLSKLVVAVDVLGGDVTEEDRDLLRRALSASDDDAMNALWTLRDGMGAVERVAAAAGLTATHAPPDASQWGDVETSAADVVRLYRYALTALPEPERDFFVAALSSAPRTAADGFEQDFGLLAPGLGAYAKQGWMWYHPAELYLHSAGVVAGRYAVALLSVQSGVDEGAARDHVTAVAKSLAAALVPHG
ncbi:Putative lipoprotein LppW [Actinosynnema sp. ALI-1.44]